MAARPVFLHQIAVIAGGAAGSHTVTGIKGGDILVGVIHESGGVAQDNLVDEFAITGDDTIDNTGGTATGGDVLIVHYLQPRR